MAGSTQERIREVGQGRAFCARRVSGRSEAESLDEPPALRTIVLGKNGRMLVCAYSQVTFVESFR
jgi:hypothetical protein